MAWKCPICTKSFAKMNQSHKCEMASEYDLFYGKDPNLFPLYKDFLKFVGSFSKPVVTTSQKAITLYAPSQKSFLIIRPRSKYLDISFPLGKKIISTQFLKVVQASAQVYFHYFRIDKKEKWEEIWKVYINEAYERAMQLKINS